MTPPSQQQPSIGRTGSSEDIEGRRGSLTLAFICLIFVLLGN
jgi:hypothetical protein